MRALDIASDLIRFDSVSSKSNLAPSQYVADFLSRLGFEIEWQTIHDQSGIEKANVIARRMPTRASVSTDHPDAKNGSMPSQASTLLGGIAYLAHTDVVPADDWNTGFNGPFEPTIRDSKLYGRGSCDMKGSLACALAAVETIETTRQTKPIYFVVTADEEVGMQGAKKVACDSKFFAEMVANEVVGIIGEPTLLQVVYAHKGGSSIRMVSRGVSAHSSMRIGVNANHRLIPIMPLLLELQQECESNPALQNQDFDPPTLSWNIVLRNEPFAMNVTPSIAEAIVFVRSMPNVNHMELFERVQTEADKLGIEFHLFKGGQPMHVDKNSEWVQQMLHIVGEPSAKTVCYATDACALTALKRIMVCGPGSINQAHCNDEWIALAEIEKGVTTYRSAFQTFA